MPKRIPRGGAPGGSSRHGQQCAFLTTPGRRPRRQHGRRRSCPALQRPTGTIAACACPARTIELEIRRHHLRRSARRMHHSVEPAGRVRRIAAAVLVDDVVESDRAGGQAHHDPPQAHAGRNETNRAVGARPRSASTPQRGDVLAVENLSFQESPLETPRRRPRSSTGGGCRALGVDAALCRTGGSVRGRSTGWSCAR